DGWKSIVLQKGRLFNSLFIARRDLKRCDRLTGEERLVMMEANKALVRRWFQEVWNDGREAAIDELFSANGIAHGLGDTEAPVHGPAEMKPFVRNLRSAIGDLRVSIED